MLPYNSASEYLEYHKNRVGEKDAIVFLENGEDKIVKHTYASLYAEALRYAAGLQARGIGKGDQLILMQPTCLEFFPFFFGAFLIGAVPIPVYPPMSLNKIDHYLKILANIVKMTQARLLITFPEVNKIIGSILKHGSCLEEILNLEEIPRNPSQVRLAQTALDDMALIQFSSGSTGMPKGIMLTYRNMLINHWFGGQHFKTNSDDSAFSWLPIYHDMGLIASVFYSLFWGITVYLMSPLHFLLKPDRWLRAIHRFGVTQSLAPNFAFSLCVNKIKAANIEKIDLSCWTMAGNASEHVQNKTVENFINRFEPYGFRRESLYPIYGLAEFTAAATIPEYRRGPKFLPISRSALASGNAVQVQTTFGPDTWEDCASVGKPYPDHHMAIVDPEGKALPELTIGQIVLQGDSLTVGYLNSPDLYQTQLSKLDNGIGNGNKPFFHTGDLGFLHQGELYVTGRLKDLIIIRGRNYYPQDIEAIVESCQGVRPGCSAAFSIPDEQGSEKLVVVAESKLFGSATQKELENRISGQIGETLGLAAKGVMILPPRTIPKTSSGKIQRNECRKLFLNKELSHKEGTSYFKMASVFTNSLLGHGEFFLKKHLLNHPLIKKLFK